MQPHALAPRNRLKSYLTALPESAALRLACAQGACAEPVCKRRERREKHNSDLGHVVRGYKRVLSFTSARQKPRLTKDGIKAVASISLEAARQTGALPWLNHEFVLAIVRRELDHCHTRTAQRAIATYIACGKLERRRVGRRFEYRSAGLPSHISIGDNVVTKLSPAEPEFAVKSGVSSKICLEDSTAQPADLMTQCDSDFERDSADSDACVFFNKQQARLDQMAKTLESSVSTYGSPKLSVVPLRAPCTSSQKFIAFTEDEARMFWLGALIELTPHRARAKHRLLRPPKKYHFKVDCALGSDPDSSCNIDAQIEYADWQQANRILATKGKEHGVSFVFDHQLMSPLSTLYYFLQGPLEKPVKKYAKYSAIYRALLPAVHALIRKATQFLAKHSLDDDTFWQTTFASKFSEESKFQTDQQGLKVSDALDMIGQQMTVASDYIYFSGTYGQCDCTEESQRLRPERYQEYTEK